MVRPPHRKIGPNRVWALLRSGEATAIGGCPLSPSTRRVGELRGAGAGHADQSHAHLCDAGGGLAPNGVGTSEVIVDPSGPGRRESLAGGRNGMESM